MTSVEESSSGDLPAGSEERFQVSYFHSGLMITCRSEKKALGLKMLGWRKPDSVDKPTLGPWSGLKVDYPPSIHPSAARVLEPV